MFGRILGLFGLAIIGILGLSVVFGSWYTIDQGERGVILRNGAIIGTAEPGLGFKIPLVDDVERISTQSQSALYENVAAYSRDQQTASMTVSINYHVPPDRVDDVYSNYGSIENMLARLVSRKMPDQVKNVFGRFNAVSAIQERERLVMESTEALQNVVNSGMIVIESLQIENIDFSDIYEQSIEARMLAEVEVQKLQQNAEREKVQAEITVTIANAEADAVRAKAAANAEAVVLAGNAEADAIRAKGAALRDNPSLIDLTAAERWTGVLPTTMIPGGSVPFLNMK